MRTGLERLRMSGAAFALPPDLTRALHTEVGPGAAGVQRHLVSWRTRSSAARSPRDRCEQRAAAAATGMQPNMVLGCGEERVIETEVIISAAQVNTYDLRATLYLVQLTNHLERRRM